MADSDFRFSDGSHHWLSFEVSCGGKKIFKGFERGGEEDVLGDMIAQIKDMSQNRQIMNVCARRQSSIGSGWDGAVGMSR